MTSETPETSNTGASVSTSSKSNDALNLFIVSVLSLFVELMLIRYIAIEVTIFAYFKNLALMACFLGLGLGFAWAHRSVDWFRRSGTIYFGLIVVLSVALILNWHHLTFANPYQFMLFGVGNLEESVPGILESAKCLGVMLLIFASTTFIFVGMGQYIGQLFEKFSPLKAYSINVVGALTGSLLFTLLCSLETPPAVWIITAGILFMLVKRTFSHAAIIAFGLVHFFLVPYVAGRGYGSEYLETLWSPYYRIDVVQVRPDNDKSKLWGYDLRVNYGTFQSIVDCSPENLARFSPAVQKGMLDAFAIPYNSLHIKPKEVLILASGNGSDVASALKNGAEHVDAVDIDPVLTRLGKTLHPEKPYLDPRVSLYVMDARTYLQNCKKKYDLIVFAYLDSHTAFSSLSSLRTDNYVFTVDSYRQACNLLNDRGLVFVSFISFKDWLWNRHTNALKEASGMVPIASKGSTDVVGVGYMVAGPGLKYLDPGTLTLPGKTTPVDTNSGIMLATDDWPFLFLPSRELSLTYVIPIMVILGFSALFIARELKSGLTNPSNWLMLLLGMGFMLLEVRAMADLSLIFGSTWFVNSCVISVVLLMILIGNFIATKVKTAHAPAVVALLVAAVMGSTLINPPQLLTLGHPTDAVVGSLLYLSPAALAAILFATLFKTVNKPAQALAFNIFGGIVGISLEYLSMQFGVRFLGWLAVAIYAATLIPMLKVRSTAASPSTEIISEST
jgi:hypothetical protein